MITTPLLLPEIVFPSPAPVPPMSVPVVVLSSMPWNAFGAAWIANDADGVLSRIDLATNELAGMVQLKAGIFAVEPVGDEIWVENYGGSEIYRIDPDAVHQ